MSIDKLVGYFASYYHKKDAFLKFLSVLKNGFWTIELLFSVVILSGFMLVLFKFNVNMIALEADSINRLEALSQVYAVLEGDLLKGEHSYGEKGIFKLDLKVCNTDIIKSNLPKYIKKGLKSDTFERGNIIISWKSSLGQAKNIRIVSGIKRSFG